MKKFIYLIFLVPSLSWADSKVSALTEDFVGNTTNYMYQIISPGGVGASRKIKVQTLLNLSGSTNYVSYSSAAASYLGISSSSALSPTAVTYSSASVSYLGKSSSTITELTKSSASVSYVGIGTYSATTGTFQKSTMTAESFQTILSSNTTTSINWQSGDAKTQTITASSTYTFTNLPTGTTSKTLNMRVINTGSFKMTWPSTIKWTTGVSGSSPTASGVTIYTFQVFDGTVYGAFIGGFSR